jgi:hypothetical protein
MRWSTKLLLGILNPSSRQTSNWSAVTCQGLFPCGSWSFISILDLTEKKSFSDRLSGPSCRSRRLS